MQLKFFTTSYSTTFLAYAVYHVPIYVSRTEMILFQVTLF